MARTQTAYLLNELEARLMTQNELAISSHKKRIGESPTDFIDRIVSEAPEILIKSEGQPEITALVFKVDVGVIEDLIREYPALQEAQTMGFSLFTTRKSEAREVADGVKRELLRKLKEEDPRPSRNVIEEPLPEDPLARIAAIEDLCPHYLRSYSGCKHQMAGPMGVPSEEIQQVIDGVEPLVVLQQVCQASPKAAALRNLQEQAATGGYAAAAKYLEKLFPEEFGPKQEVKFKGGGFEPPPSGPPPNALWGTKTEEPE